MERLIDANELYKLPCVHGAEGTWICLEDIRNIPTVEAEPVKHGHWIREPNCWYRCSECGSHYPSIADNMNYHYCPDCGAKMTLD